jgi:hypothetical protein
VGTIAKALSAFDEAELRRRYDGNAMNAADLYPDDWNDPENLDWLVQEFDQVRGFYSRTAGRGNAALLYHI